MGESLCPNCRLYPICGRVNRGNKSEQQALIAVDEDCNWYDPRPEVEKPPREYREWKGIP